MMMLPSIVKIGILIDFKIHQDFIAKVLCIKKDEPAASCNGMCHLKKKLNEADEPEQKKAPDKKNNRIQFLDCFVKSSFSFSTFEITYIDELKAQNRDSLYHSAFIVDIFHPPKKNFI